MKITLKAKNGSSTKVQVQNINKVGRVNFNKIARADVVTSLGALTDVITENKKDGDVLVYQSNTNTYNIKTLPKIDGGEF